jgi:transcriptional regulator with XRE-family HTH domain
MSVVDEIRRALISDKRSSAEIARAAGIHAVNVRQFKGGIRSLPLDTLEQLASALGLDITAKKRIRRR